MTVVVPDTLEQSSPSTLRGGRRLVLAQCLSYTQWRRGSPATSVPFRATGVPTSSGESLDSAAAGPRHSWQLRRHTALSAISAQRASSSLQARTEVHVPSDDSSRRRLSS